MRHFAYFALLLLLLFRPGVAHADTTNNNANAANELFDVGRTLMDEQRYAEACPKFEASNRLSAGIGTMLNLAVCYEKLGKNASAWSTYREAAALARDKGQTDREQFARESVDRLAPTLLKASIGVEPQAGIDKISVTIDGAALPASLWGSPTPLDPGEHVVEATAPGKLSWKGTIKVEGAQTPPLTVPLLKDAPTPVVASSSQPGTDRNSGKAQRRAALLVGGVGVVGIVVGSIFGIMAKSDYDSSEENCRNNHCTDEGSSDRSAAYDKAKVSTVAFAVGGAALVGGAVLWFTAAPEPKKAPDPKAPAPKPAPETQQKAAARLQLRTAFGPGRGEIVLGGAF